MILIIYLKLPANSYENLQHIQLKTFYYKILMTNKEVNTAETFPVARRYSLRWLPPKLCRFVIKNQ